VRVAAGVDEIGAKDPIALTDEGVMPVPLVHAEILIEVVRERVPRDEFPPHPLLQALDLDLRGARDIRERRSRAFKWAGCATWSAPKEQPTQARSG
jgi:hypothetical protein